MGDQSNAPERLEAAWHAGSRSLGSIVNPVSGEYPGWQCVGYVRDDVHDRVVAERDEAQAELAWTVGERGAYREAIENALGHLVGRDSGYPVSHAVSLLRAVLAEGEQPARRAGEQPAGEAKPTCPRCGSNDLGSMVYASGERAWCSTGCGWIASAGGAAPIDDEQLVEEARSRCEGISSHRPDLQFFHAICDVLTERGHLRPAAGEQSTTEPVLQRAAADALEMLDEFIAESTTSDALLNAAAQELRVALNANQVQGHDR